MDTSLTWEARQDTGKGVARKLRASDKVPAIVYAEGKAARLGVIDPARLLEIFRKSKNANTVVELQIDGQTVSALVQEAQRNPVSRKLLHVDFYEVTSDRPVEVMVPVRTFGKAAGAAAGGRVELVRREIKVRCAFDAIPESIEIDASPLDIGDAIKASAIVAPEGVTVVYTDDFKVVACVGKKK